MDNIGLIWSVLTIIIGVTALLRSSSIGKAMKNIHERSQMGKVLTSKDLKDRTTLYIKLFGVVWICCGVFWACWILFHGKHL